LSLNGYSGPQKLREITSVN